MKRTILTTTALAVAAVPFLAACGTESTEQAEGERAFTVTSSDDACEVSGAEAPEGTLTFDVTNSGGQVTEFYLLGEDGLRVVGEVENIGEGANSTLTVNAPAGDYFTACKPGMKGDGIRNEFTVTQDEEGAQQLADSSNDEQVQQALDAYKLYVRDQSAQLLEQTTEFVELYKSGTQDDEARALYPLARQHWERIEPVAESFGNLDPKMDLREADVEGDDPWTGWHRIEKDLWPARAEKYRALTPEDRAFYADDLLANTKKLDEKVQDVEYTIDDLANGSKTLLEEVANGKVTGEEEYWSRTDLYDFQANIDGARVAYENVRPIVEENAVAPDDATEEEQAEADKNAALVEDLDASFEELQTLLDAQRDGDAFTLYDDLSEDEIQDFANAVNALAEPLSQLTAAVV